MRIALLTYSTRPRGGVVHTLALAEALASLGVDVTVITLGRKGDDGFFRPVAPEVAVEVVPFPEVEGESVGARVLRSIATLGPAVRPERFDLVHAQDCISANACPGTIRTVHHIDHFETPELVRCHERALVEPMAHVCVSQAVADELRHGWGITATVIPNGVDAARFERATPSFWPERIGAPYILAVGGIEPRKGTIDLVDAMAELRSTHPSVRLVIAGGETLFDYRDYRERFDRRGKDLGVTPLVLGPVADPELPPLVAGATAFAFPSIKEGFGLAPLEAAAAGVPIVMRDLPVLREVFGSVPRWFGPATGATLAAGLRRAIDHPDDRATESGRQLARRYTWTAAAAAHLALYRALTDQGGVSSQRSSGSRGLESPTELPSGSSTTA